MAGTLAQSCLEMVNKIAMRCGFRFPLSQSDIEACVGWLGDGLRRFRMGQMPKEVGGGIYVWKFFETPLTLDLWPDVAVGTATVSASGTTVTASAATFYPSMVRRTLTVTDIGTRTITGYVSATQATVDSTFSGTHTFSIASLGLFGLPDSYNGMISPVCYVHDGLGAPLVTQVDPWEIAARYRDYDYNAYADPIMFAQQQSSPTIGALQTTDFYVWPMPSRYRRWVYQARLKLFAPTYSASAYLPGAEDHADTYVQCAMAEREMDLQKRPGPEHEHALEMAGVSRLLDESMYGREPQQSMQQVYPIHHPLSIPTT